METRLKNPSPGALEIEPLADPRQRRFCALVILLGNASEAYRQAGYTGKPNVQAAKMLARPAIRRELPRLRRATTGTEAEIEAARSPAILAIRQMREVLAEVMRNPRESLDDRIAAIRQDARIMANWSNLPE